MSEDRHAEIVLLKLIHRDIKHLSKEWRDYMSQLLDAVNTLASNITDLDTAVQAEIAAVAQGADVNAALAKIGQMTATVSGDTTQLKASLQPATPPVTPPATPPADTGTTGATGSTG